MYVSFNYWEFLLLLYVTLYVNYIIIFKDYYIFKELFNREREKKGWEKGRERMLNTFK